MNRVFLYVRVSTEEQAIHGLSIEAQETALTAWAKDGEYKVIGTYVDAGISARKPASKRPALQRLLNDVRAGKGDMVVFTKLDRWFRSVGQYYQVQDVLEANHVSWRAIHEDYETATASGRLKVNIMLSVAQDEADRTGERIKFVHESKVQKGEVISGKVPLGYKIENKKMALDFKTAPIAQDIFRQYTVLRSVRALREYVLNKYGLVYGQTGIRAMLSNERYIGRAHEQDDFCPPLIPKEQFQLCQELLQQRAQRNLARSDRVYLFTGLVRCAECGNRLSAHVAAQKYTYYRCTRYEKLHLCPHKKRTSELVLEQWLLENLVSSYEQYNLSLAQRAAIKRSSVDTDKVKRKMEKLKDLYLNDLIEKEAYERDYVSLRAQLREAYTPEPLLPNPVDIKKIKTVLSAYERLTRQEKKEFWGRVVGTIIITNDDRFFVEPVRHN